MNHLPESKSISFEEAMHDPAFAHLRDALAYVSTASDEELSPRKFKAAHKDSISRIVKSLHAKKPNTPLRHVIFAALENVPEGTTTKTILELTKWAIAEWEGLAMPTAKRQSSPQLAR